NFAAEGNRRGAFSADGEKEAKTIGRALLLRVRRARPRHCRACEHSDELASSYPVHSRGSGNPGARVCDSGSDFGSAALHSITSSAIASTPGGMARPSSLAVLRLMTNSSLVGCMIGRSAGFSPLRIRPV